MFLSYPNQKPGQPEGWIEITSGHPHGNDRVLWVPTGTLFHIIGTKIFLRDKCCGSINGERAVRSHERDGAAFACLP